jgi:hypothetical protein
MQGHQTSSLYYHEHQNQQPTLKGIPLCLRTSNSCWKFLCYCTLDLVSEWKHYYSPSNSHWLLNCILRCTCVYKILFPHSMLSLSTAMWEITISQNTVKCPYNKIISVMKLHCDRLCGLVVIPGYRSRGPGSIPGATRFSE